MYDESMSMLPYTKLVDIPRGTWLYSTSYDALGPKIAGLIPLDETLFRPMLKSPYRSTRDLCRVRWVGKISSFDYVAQLPSKGWQAMSRVKFIANGHREPVDVVVEATEQEWQSLIKALYGLNVTMRDIVDADPSLEDLVCSLMEAGDA